MKDLKHYKKNAEEDYVSTPISVLRYITELEKSNNKQREALKVLLNGNKNFNTLKAAFEKAMGILGISNPDEKSEYRVIPDSDGGL